MRKVTKTMVTRGYGCERRLELELRGVRWGIPPLPQGGPPAHYAATHYALAQIHRAWLRRERPQQAQLNAIWQEAWARSRGDGDPPAEGVAFLERYELEDPFALRNGRQLIGIEVEMIIPAELGGGLTWSTRPDAICLSIDRTRVELLEFTQAARLRDVELPSCLNQIAAEICLPPRFRDFGVRSIYAHLPVETGEDVMRSGYWEADTSVRDPADVLQGLAGWLLDVRSNGGIASPELAGCGACPFAQSGDCVESLFWTPEVASGRAAGG